MPIRKAKRRHWPLTVTLLTMALLTSCSSRGGDSDLWPLPSRAASLHGTLYANTTTTGGRPVVNVYLSGSRDPIHVIKSGAAAMGFDREGNLYLADDVSVPNRVNVYAAGSSRFLRAIQNGIRQPTALAFDRTGDLYVGNEGGAGPPSVTVYPPGSNRPKRRFARYLGAPTDLVFDKRGVLYLESATEFITNFRISVFAAGSTRPTRTIFLGQNHGGAMAIDRTGELFVANEDYGVGRSVYVYAPGGTRPARIIRDGIRGPVALAFDSRGNLYVSNAGAGTVTVYAAGAAHPERVIKMDQPWGIALDPSDILYAVDGYPCLCIEVFRSRDSRPWYTIPGISGYLLALSPG